MIEKTRVSQAPAILWLRRDLRLADNPALAAAIASGLKVLPVYVLDRETPGPWAPGAASLWWLHHSLASLGAAFTAAGAQLVLRRGRTADVLRHLAHEVGAAEIHTGRAVEPWARDVLDDIVATAGVPVHTHRTSLLFDPESIRTQSGGAYGVFTPFARACLARPAPAAPLPAPDAIPGATGIASDRLEDWRLLPDRPDWAAGLRATWVPGEKAAAARLAKVTAKIVGGYDRTRNLPGQDGTSALSPRLHWGELSPGQIWHAVDKVEGAGRDAFITELLWREFSANLLWQHPNLPDTPLRPEFARMPVRDDPAGLRAWQRGRTGIPIVDAGMRQLWELGWMHNRVRMIVASFLVKHQLLQWQEGEAWFWDTLVDADLASNSAQWQWVAGCGADAAPYFRVFNPVLQGRKFDTDGAYVRRFVPELARLSDHALQAPWEASAVELAAAGVRLGATYPHPVLDLAAGRARALAAYKQLGSMA